MTYCLNHPDRVTEGTTEFCGSCNRANRKMANAKILDDPKPVKKNSPEMTRLMHIYVRRRKWWIKGKKCAAKFQHDCTGELTLHHMQGRVGFADEYARENDLPLLLDERFWLPVCLEAHQYIENHKKWACENGYTFLRVTDPVFRKVKQ